MAFIIGQRVKLNALKKRFPGLNDVNEIEGAVQINKDDSVVEPTDEDDNPEYLKLEDEITNLYMINYEAYCLDGRPYVGIELDPAPDRHHSDHDDITALATEHETVLAKIEQVKEMLAELGLSNDKVALYFVPEIDL